MIQSMTGYGIATNDFGKAKYTVEIKSLNSKFLELTLKLPKAFSDKEFTLRHECSKHIERGKSTVTITIEYNDATVKAAKVDTELLKHFYNQLKPVSQQLDASADHLLTAILKFPEVVQYNEDTSTEEEGTHLLTTFTEALKNFQQFRKDEGAVLEKELVLRIENILKTLHTIDKEEPNRVPLIKERLNHFLSEAIRAEHIDANRLEQELIYYIEKLDITEEKVRLKSHCDYFLGTLQSPEANGKKLGFIAQEIGREINTMGAKANDAAIQHLVVDMKEELEKIKEQLLNVL